MSSGVVYPLTCRNSTLDYAIGIRNRGRRDVVICGDCRRSYKRASWNLSCRWCPECVLDHVGLCRSCRRVFDREDPSQVVCVECVGVSSVRSAWVPIVGAAISVQVLVLLIVAMRKCAPRVGDRR